MLPLNLIMPVGIEHAHSQLRDAMIPYMVLPVFGICLFMTTGHVDAKYAVPTYGQFYLRNSIICNIDIK